MPTRPRMIERAKATAVLSLGVLHIAGCQTFQYREPYLHMLQTDSAEVAVRGAIVRIGFSFANMTGKPISGGCEPILERMINAKWKLLPRTTLLDCMGITLERGAIFHTQFEMLTSHVVEDLALAGVRGADSIDGVYRLRWSFVEGRDSHSARARPVSGVSNEFRLEHAAR
jgi:hypothetical protein